MLSRGMCVSTMINADHWESTDLQQTAVVEVCCFLFGVCSLIAVPWNIPGGSESCEITAKYWESSLRWPRIFCFPVGRWWMGISRLGCNYKDCGTPTALVPIHSTKPTKLTPGRKRLFQGCCSENCCRDLCRQPCRIRVVVSEKKVVL